jgi:hypothetical protein
MESEVECTSSEIAEARCNGLSVSINSQMLFAFCTSICLRGVTQSAWQSTKCCIRRERTSKFRSGRHRERIRLTQGIADASRRIISLLGHKHQGLIDAVQKSKFND